MSDYELDPLLDETLREQMIEGGVPEDEVQPSIDDIEESMGEKLENNDRLTSMKNKKGADIMNPGHQTPRYDAPFDQEPADQEFTDEDYASVSPEVNEKVIKFIREMRAAGVPMPEIMRQAREMIEASIAAGKGVDTDIINQRFAMPNEHLGWYDEKFWNEVEGKEDEGPDCPQPHCHDGKLEKEQREDGRDDVWRCKSCKGRTSDTDLKKEAALDDLDDNEPFVTLNFTEAQFGGLFDALTLGERMGWLEIENADDLFDYLDYVYGNTKDAEEEIFSLELDAETYNTLKQLFDTFKSYSLDNVFWRKVIAENEDLSFGDIGDAWMTFNQAEEDPSSAENLEAIPTMENEEAPMGEEAEVSFGNCPQCGVDAVDPEIAQCTNCGWDQDNACPECFSDRSLYLEEDGSKHCNNCGWNDAANQPGALPPATPAGRENTRQDPLEQQFNLPAAEHPLGPHTGAERSDIFGVWSPSGDRQNRKWLLRIDTAQNQQSPQEGDTVEARSYNSGAKPVILTNLVRETDGYTLWETKNAPFNNEPWRPKLTSTQELYTSGSFVKGPDGRWLVAINPAGGQRDPEPGDWATIQQRTKSFNRPVPLTLVEDMGGAWKFRNGHHPSIESQVEDETL